MDVNLDKFFLIISKAVLLFSTKKLSRSSEIHSIPNEPTPEYKSSTLELTDSVLGYLVNSKY